MPRFIGIFVLPGFSQLYSLQFCHYRVCSIVAFRVQVCFTNLSVPFGLSHLILHCCPRSMAHVTHVPLLITFFHPLFLRYWKRLTGQAAAASHNTHAVAISPEISHSQETQETSLKPLIHDSATSPPFCAQPASLAEQKS